MAAAGGHDAGHFTHSDMFECGMASSLVQAWADCELSACKVQFWAHKTYSTLKCVLEALGHTTEHIPKPIRCLAALGSWGRTPGNCARDLKNYLGQPSSIVAPEFVAVQVKVANQRHDSSM